MKIRKIITAAIMLVGVGFLVGANAYAAPTFLGEEAKASQSVGKEETVEGTLFAAGNSVRVDGTVEGDVFCAGSSIVVAGTVNGDVICAGSTITIDGTVNGDVRAAASTITVNGTIEGNASLAASDVLISTDANIKRDLMGGAATVTLDGTIGRDLLIGAESIVVNGNVKRDITAGVSELSVNEGATVGGDIAYTSDKRATINGTVNGETVFTESDEAKRSSDATGVAGAAGMLMFLLMVGLMVFFGAVVAPRAVQAFADVSWASFGIAAVVGVTVVLLSPLFIIVLLLTAIGAYAAWIWLLLWLLLMALAPIWFGYFVGTKMIGNRSGNVLLRATVGALTLMLALIIPVLNVITFFAMLFIGVGLPLLAVPKMFSGKPYEAHETTDKKPAPKKKAST